MTVTAENKSAQAIKLFMSRIDIDLDSIVMKKLTNCCRKQYHELIADR